MAATLGTVHSRSQLMNSAALVGTVYPSALMTRPGLRFESVRRPQPPVKETLQQLQAGVDTNIPGPDQAFAKPSFPAFLMPGSESLPYAPTTNT